MNPKDTITLANEMIGEHLATEWTFRLTRAESYIGYCNTEKKRIYLSKAWMDGYGGRPPAEIEVRQVLLHEIAHALHFRYIEQAFHAGQLTEEMIEVHGVEWGTTALAIGVNPTHVCSLTEGRVAA